jgi:DUF4097 and DUF4098 domain-containing protein YvlB
MKKLVTVLLLSLTFFAQKSSIKESFDGITHIEVELGSGDATISKSSTSKVTVESDYRFKNEDDKPLVEKRGSKLIISERRRNGKRLMWNSNSYKAEWKLTIPNDITLEFTTGSGDIESEDVEYEEIEVNTGSGKIVLRGSGGEAHLNTGSGRILIQEHVGDIRTNTGSGEIVLRNVKGRIQGNTGSGDIQVEESQGGFRLNTGSGDIELSQTSVIKKTSLNTGSGDVVLSLKSEIEGNLSMNTGSGDILLDYNGVEIKGYIEMTAKRESRIRAPFEFERTEKIKQWGGSYIVKSATITEDEPEVSLSTGSGRVTIKK